LFRQFRHAAFTKPYQPGQGDHEDKTTSDCDQIVAVIRFSNGPEQKDRQFYQKIGKSGKGNDHGNKQVGSNGGNTYRCKQQQGDYYESGQPCPSALFALESHIFKNLYQPVFSGLVFYLTASFRIEQSPSRLLTLMITNLTLIALLS
jgi:hypothetical protein